MSDYDDNETEEFSDQLQNVIDQTPKEFLVVQRYWNAKGGKGACGNWQGICGPFCNKDTNERELRLLELATFNDLVLANTFGNHKASRRWTWHSPNGQHHSQIDYILVKKCFRSRVNIARTWKFSRSRHWKWPQLADDDLPPSPEKNQQAKTPKTQVWPWKDERSQCVGNLPSYGRWEVCTSYHHEQWRNRPGFNCQHLQHRSDWNSHWDPWQTLSEERTLSHCRNSWSVQQKERTEIIWSGRRTGQ